MDGEELLAELSQYLLSEHPDVKVNRQLKHKGWGSWGNWRLEHGWNYELGIGGYNCMNFLIFNGCFGSIYITYSVIYEYICKCI